MLVHLKRKLLSLLLRKLYHAVSVEDILYENPKTGKLHLYGRELSRQEVSNLGNQARTLQELQLWTALTNQAKYVSNQRMFEQSASWDDMFFGKACLYIVGLQEDIVNKLSKL